MGQPGGGLSKPEASVLNSCCLTGSPNVQERLIQPTKLVVERISADRYRVDCLPAPEAPNIRDSSATVTQLGQNTSTDN